jgi:hypothetical protein
VLPEQLAGFQLTLKLADWMPNPACSGGGTWKGLNLSSSRKTTRSPGIDCML